MRVSRRHSTNLVRYLSDLSGTKESAYIHALTSAGIAYAITKACSTGRLSSCGCDMSMKESTSNQTQRWSGCSDNVLFGSELARKFVNLRERVNKNRTSLLNVHNNQVGIRVRRFVWIRWFSVKCSLIPRRYSRPSIVSANVTVCQVHVNLRPAGARSVRSLKSLSS